MKTLDQRINEAAENQSMRLTSSLVDADTRARIYKDAAGFTKSLMLKEFEPVIKALEEIAYDGSSREYCTRISEQALKQWREKVGTDE